MKEPKQRKTYVPRRSERTDHVSPTVRSSIMRAVKSKGARSTEQRLRSAMVSRGLRGWRLNSDSLPGKPDFLFANSKLAVFVDGCFWHGCPKCYRRPNSNQSYWDTKVARNIARDKINRAELRKLGWQVLRFWEHDIKKNCIAVAEEIESRLIKN